MKLKLGQFFKSQLISSVFVAMMDLSANAEGTSYSEKIFPNSKSNSGFGLSIAGTMNSKAIGPSQSFLQFSPELAGFYLSSIKKSWHWSLGVRLSYTRSDNTDYDVHSVNIRERDFKLITEGGLRWQLHRLLLPQLSVGVGAVSRYTDLSTQLPVVSSNSLIQGGSVLPVIQGQLGVVIPFVDQRVEVTPLIRYVQIFSDSRVNWYSGLEASFYFF